MFLCNLPAGDESTEHLRTKAYFPFAAFHLRRPRRPTAAPLKLEPLPSARVSPEGYNGDPVDTLRRATKSGAGCSAHHQKATKHTHPHQRTRRRDDCGGGDGRIVCGANHTNDAVTSPSLDILTRGYGQDGENAMVRNLTAVETAPARAPSTGEEGCGERTERGKLSWGKDGEGIEEEARNSEGRTPKLQKARSAAAKEKQGGEGTRGSVVGDQSPPGQVLTSKARYSIEDARSGDAQRCCDAVLPLALPGEAHNMSFGAAAKAVVLVSGSSRLLVSRCSATNHGKP